MVVRTLALILLASSPASLSARVPIAVSLADRSVQDTLMATLAVSPSDYAGKDYVLLLDETVARLEADGGREITYRKVVQILTQRGAENWGELAIQYDPTRTNLFMNWVRVYSASGARLSEGPAHEQESTPDVSFNAPVYTAERVKRFTVGGIASGTILDVSYTFEQFRPPYPSDFHFTWSLNSLVDVRQSRFVVDLPDSIVPRVRQLNMVADPREYTEGDRRVLEWSTGAVPAVEPEYFPGLPNDVLRRVTVSSSLPWDSIAAWYHELSHDRYAIIGGALDELSEHLGEALTERDSIVAAHRWVAQDFRYVSLALGDGGYQPRLPSDVLESRFGDCKDKTTLFVGVLAAMGVDAYPVLVSATADVDALVPTMHQFDHMIAAVETARGLEYTDLTSELTPFGRLPHGLQGRFGLLVRPEGSGDPVVLPADEPSGSVRAVHIAGELSEDGSFDGSLVIRASGIEELSLRQTIGDLAGLADADILALGETLAGGYLERAVVDSARVLDGFDLSESPAAAVWIKVRALATRSGSKLVLPLPLPDNSMHPWISELEADTLRRFPIDVEQFNGPSKHRTEFLVVLPAGWRAELPSNVEVEGAFGHYRAVYGQQGRTLRAMRELVGRRGLEPPDSIVALIAWMRAVSEDRAQYVLIEEFGGDAVADSLATVSAVALTFGWPVGMESRVRGEFTRVRSVEGMVSDSSVSTISHRVSVHAHELGRLIEFNEFENLAADDTPTIETFAQAGALGFPTFVVDEAGTLVGLEDFGRFLVELRRALGPMIDSLQRETPAFRDLLERMLNEPFFYSKALELWSPLVYQWSDTEMEIGVAYESEGEEQSPLYPEALIGYDYVHRLESRVSCGEQRSDSACVRLSMQSRADPEAVQRLLTRIFADMLKQPGHDGPVIEAFDVRTGATLVTEPETLIPHHLVVTHHMSVTVRDGSGQSTTTDELRKQEYWYQYGQLHADRDDVAPLIEAAASGDLEAATRALQDGENLESRDPLGRTPLMVAASGGNESLVRLLLFRGANANATDRAGRSVLVWAALGEHAAVVGHLVRAGANLDHAYDFVRSRGLVGAIPALQRAGLQESLALPSGLLDSARSVYRRGQLAEALPLFVDAVARDARNADALAWVAEVQWRLGNSADAVATARLATARNACHGHALSVIGRAHDSQYGARPHANADTSWHYLKRAVECAPHDGNVWLDIVFPAMRVGEYQVERQALRRLMSTEFLTPSTVATARWLLENAPHEAILLTNGDMDTFPLLALQEVEQLRRDVVVVNKPMLNLAWYRNMLAERYGLLRPDEIREDLDIWQESPDGTVPVTAADTAIAVWRAASLTGRIRRPFAVALSVVFAAGSAGPGQWEFHGPYMLAVDSVRALDREALYGRYQQLDPRDFRGSDVASVDRSSVRQQSLFGPSSMIPFSAIYPALILDDDEWLAVDTTTLHEIVRLVEWTERFARESQATRSIDVLRQTLAETYLDLGRGYGAHADFDKAIRFSQLATAFDSAQAKGLNNTGYYSLLRGDVDTAVVYLERAHAARPSLGTLLNLADASRLRGDLVAALSWEAEAERLATGDRLEDENFMWGKWAYPYLEVDGIDDPSQWKRVQVEMTDEKLAMIHYWAAITHAAAGDTEAAMESLGVAMNLSPRVDVHCVVHNRIDAMISRFDDREGMVGWLKSLADRLASRDVACVRA